MRTSGGTRIYSESDIERARHIRMLVHEGGYSLTALARAKDDAITSGATAADVDEVLRRLVRAESGWQGAVALVEGVKALTGVGTASLGIYQRWRESLLFIVTARAGKRSQLGGAPIDISAFPGEWQQAIDTTQSCSHPDLLRLKLAASLGTWVRENQTRSFHAAPLTMGKWLIGVLMVGSPFPAGITDKAREICERLALSAGPAVRYFAAQF